MSSSTQPVVASPPSYNADNISNMIMMQDRDALRNTYGGVDGMVKLLKSDEENGIDTGSIGDRSRIFGEGDLRIRQQISFAQMERAREDRILRRRKQREAAKAKNEKNKEKKKEKRRRESDDDDSSPFSFFDQLKRNVDLIQNRMEYDVVRDGGEVKKVKGCEIAVGDILHLSFKDLAPKFIEEFRMLDGKNPDSISSSSSSSEESDDDINHNQNDDDTAQMKKIRKRLERIRKNNRVKPLVPADCLVLAGTIQQDYSELTGESDAPTCSRDRNPFLLASAKILSGECIVLVCCVGKGSSTLRLALDADVDSGMYRRGVRNGSCCCVA